MEPSPELSDEIEALNAIYGPSTLTLSRDPPSNTNLEVLLALPRPNRSTIRLGIPPTYPSFPPHLLGTYSTGSSRGIGASDLEIFERALNEVYSPGTECLFDAIEEWARVLDSIPPASPSRSPSPQDLFSPGLDLPDPLPNWISTPVTVEMKSSFVAHVTHSHSPVHAKASISYLLSMNPRLGHATHNISAWRIRGDGSSSSQDFDDDGESAAGARLLHLLQMVDVWDVVVVVSRWFGGVKMGPRRFAVINRVAREGLVLGGLVEGEGEKGKKGRK